MNKIVFAQMAARLEGGAGEQKKTGMLAFSRIMEAEEKVGVATISGYIGYGNATVDEFTKHLEELKAEGCTKFEVILNSMGGNLFEASGIYDIIKGCGMEVTAKIYGVAASAATLIACAAGRVLISENSRYMVHRARGCAMGTVEEIEAYAADLKDAEGQVTGIYAERTGKSPEDVLAVLNAETLEFEQYALLESGTITIMGDDMSMFYSVTVDAKSGDYSVKVDYTGMMFSASSAGASLSPVAPAAKVGARSRSRAGESPRESALRAGKVTGHDAGITGGPCLHKARLAFRRRGSPGLRFFLIRGRHDLRNIPLSL